MASTSSTPLETQSPHCQAGVKLQVVCPKTDLRPYSERKSRRGRKKCVSKGGFACPNEACIYSGITDETIHALVGYGKDNGIQRLNCQACANVFTCRVNTPLYDLKSDPKIDDFIFWFLAIG